MGTRGTYGIRKNGIDKLSYKHYDSYPTGLGAEMVSAVASLQPCDLDFLFDRIVLVDSQSEPSAEQKAMLSSWNTAGTGSGDWYEALHDLQGRMDLLFGMANECGVAYMPDAADFIKDSLFCEYGYIINLDTGKLEMWVGFQNEPQEGNRYGHLAYTANAVLNPDDPAEAAQLEAETAADPESVYYPCALVGEWDLACVKAHPFGCIDIMKQIDEDERRKREMVRMFLETRDNVNARLTQAGQTV